MFLSDYVRQWKRHQAEFRALEISKTKAKYEEAHRALESQQEYQALLKKVEQARKEYDAHHATLEVLKKEMEPLRAKSDLTEHDYKLAKAKLESPPV